MSPHAVGAYRINLFVVTNAQHKDLKSTPVPELHRNKLTRYIQIYKMNVFIFS